jgi:hypothetical protein
MAIARLTARNDYEKLLDIALSTAQSFFKIFDRDDTTPPEIIDLEVDKTLQKLSLPGVPPEVWYDTGVVSRHDYDQIRREGVGLRFLNEYYQNGEGYTKKHESFLSGFLADKRKFNYRT